MATINTTITANRIDINSDTLRDLGAIPKLGESLIEHTGNGIEFSGDVFFEFWQVSESLSGEKSYSQIDLSSLSATALERMNTMLFLNYYNNSELVSELSAVDNSFQPLAERLTGSITTTDLATNLNMPNSSSSFVEFVGMGLGSYFGATYINGGSDQIGTSTWGNRVAQVHVTSQNPNAAGEKIYDNSDSGCWRFNNFFSTGVIVYTNCTSAFTNGFGHWAQYLCVWPVISEIFNADYANIFSNLDQLYMRSGLGFFDRSSRIDKTYGWSGNYIMSIFNDWSIPIIAPLASLSDIGIACWLTYIGQNNRALTDKRVNWRWLGPTADYNIPPLSNEKAIRSLLPMLWANECRNTNTGANSAIPDYETKVAAHGHSGSSYLAACLNNSTEGYNSHLLKGLGDNFFTSFPSSVYGYIMNGLSWYPSLSMQTNLGGVFCDEKGAPKFYEPAIDDFYGTGAGTYGTALKEAIKNTVLVDAVAMSSIDASTLESYVYTPM